MDLLAHLDISASIQVYRHKYITIISHTFCDTKDGASYGSETGCRTYAIKRYIADEYLVRAACGQKGYGFLLVLI